MENCGLFVFNSNNDSFQLYFWQIVLNWCLLEGFFVWLNKNNNLLHLFKFTTVPLCKNIFVPVIFIKPKHLGISLDRNCDIFKISFSLIFALGIKYTLKLQVEADQAQWIGCMAINLGLIVYELNN